MKTIVEFEGAKLELENIVEIPLWMLSKGKKIPLQNYDLCQATQAK